MSDFWKWLTLVFIGFIFLAAITHAKGFATSAGSLFTGFTGLGTALSGVNTKQGS